MLTTERKMELDRMLERWASGRDNVADYMDLDDDERQHCRETLDMAVDKYPAAWRDAAYRLAVQMMDMERAREVLIEMGRESDRIVANGGRPR